MVRRLLASSSLLAILTVTGLAAAEGPPEAPARPSFTVTDGRLVLPAPIAFETGTATPTADSRPVIAFVGAFLADKTYISTLRIEGHVAEGTPKAQALSEQRALGVARALVAQGADCKRLLPVGFGDTKPVAANDSAEGRAANTRVEVAPAAIRDRAIGGMPLDGGGRVAGDPCAR